MQVNNFKDCKRSFVSNFVIFLNSIENSTSITTAVDESLMTLEDEVVSFLTAEETSKDVTMECISRFKAQCVGLLIDCSN